MKKKTLTKCFEFKENEESTENEDASMMEDVD
jgi:hypothetical protein